MRRTLLYAAPLLAALLYKISTTPEWQRGLGDAAETVVRPVVIPLVDLIGKPAFVYLTSFAIVLCAIAVCISYYARWLRPRLRALRQVRTRILRLPFAEVHTPADSAAALQQLGDVLRGAGLFVVAWSAFQAQAAREGRIPEAPFAFFAAQDASLDEGERRGFMQAMPGYFTSVGLILTFIGLVVALYFASRGFRSGNIEDARDAVLKLLQASSFKFLTSVAALVSSFLISLILRFGLSRIRHETEEAIALIESYLSSWRSRQEAATGLRPPLAEVVERLDTLIDRLAAIAAHLDGRRQAPATLGG